MLHDLRHTVRAIAHAKGVATVLLVSLALGTGVNAAVYGVLDALLMRAPAGVGDPSTLVTLYTSEYSGTAYGPTSHADFQSLADTTIFSTVAAMDDDRIENVRIEARDTGAFARVVQISETFFETLRMQPLLGRLDVATTNGAATAVISEQLAEDLGGADGVVGQTLTMGDQHQPYTVTGVTPRLFRGLRAERESDVWIAMASPSSARGDRRLEILGRLGAGVDPGAAQEQLERLSSELASRYPESNRGNLVDAEAPRRLTITPYSRLDPATSEQTVLIGVVVGGASSLLLLAACLNAGGLLLSWAMSRRRELAIKMALGAGRAMLIRQLLVEALCLSLAGGALGLLFAAWMQQAIPALFMTEQAALLETRLDARLLALTVGVACAAGAIFGVAPALQATAAPAVTALRADSGGLGQGQGGARLRSLLVSGQVTLATILLLGTGTLVATLDNALEGDLAAAARQVATIAIELPGRFHDEPRGAAARTALLAQAAKAGGVTRTAWASLLPLERARRNRFRIASSNAQVADARDFEVNLVTPTYFEVLGLRLIEGRIFDDRDAALAPPVVVVDELLARRHFGRDAIGEYLIDNKGERLEIVGVVQSGRYRTLQQAPYPTVYFPVSQSYLYTGHLLARTAGDPALALETLSRVASGIDGVKVTLRGTATLEDRLGEALTLDRLTTTLVGACGLVALAMSALGVYGIMIDAVQRRTREIGLRVALGARPARVVRLVLLEAVYPAAAGLSLGALIAFALAKAAQSAFFGVLSADVRALVAAAALLAIVMLIAAVVPLQRALRVHPNIALRDQ
jgi:predicted permease